MNIIQKALKGLTINFSGSRGFLGTTMPRSKFNYASSAKPLLNAPVMACVGWLTRNFPEAPVLVERRNKKGEWELEPGHPAALLLKRPNLFYSGSLLAMAYIADFIIDGNAYLQKVRSGAGRPVQLWWLPASLVEPKWKDDGSDFISHYEYTPGSTTIKLPIGDVVHLRYGLDPENVRKGRSPLKAVLREIVTDDEAANFTASLLRNLGVPGVILSPESDMGNLAEEDLKQIKDKFRETFGGDNRGDVMLTTTPTKVSVLSFNPQQMDLRSLRQITEERISAVLGVPAIVAGLGAGLSRSTFANMKEAREMGYENGIIPLQRLIAAELTEQLLMEFEPNTDASQIAFDLREVRVLQEDEDTLATRVSTLVGGGIMKRAEGRRRLGLDAEESDEIYYVPLAIDERKPGEEPPALPGEMTPKSLATTNGHKKDYGNGFQGA